MGFYFFWTTLTIIVATQWLILWHRLQFLLTKLSIVKQKYKLLVSQCFSVSDNNKWNLSAQKTRENQGNQSALYDFKSHYEMNWENERIGTRVKWGFMSFYSKKEQEFFFKRQRQPWHSEAPRKKECFLSVQMTDKVCSRTSPSPALLSHPQPNDHKAGLVWSHW